jgi:prefoldin subunit 5
LSQSRERRRPSIDDSSLPTELARTFFETTAVEPSVATDLSHSGRIDIKSKGYRTYRVKETLKAKIARLKNEIEQVRQDVDDIDDEAELDELKDVLEQLEKTTVSKNKASSQSSDAAISTGIAQKFYSSLGLKSSGSAAITTTVASDTTGNDSNPKRQDTNKQILEMENRVSKIEKLLGSVDTTQDITPLRYTLQDLKTKLSLLTSTPAAVETTVRNLQPLIATVDAIKDKQQPSAIIAQQDRIKKFYEQLAKFENFQALMPKVLQRLQCLSEIHADASNANATFKDMDRVISALRSDLGKWEKSIEEMEQRFVKIEETSQKNKETVKAWIDDFKGDTN